MESAGKRNSGLWWKEDGVGRGCITRTARRSGGGHCPLFRLHQLAQLGLFFVSQGLEEGALTAVWFVGLVAMVFRAELIVFSGVVYRWCAVLESEVSCTERSTAAESLGTVGAMEPHGRGTDK